MLRSPGQLPLFGGSRQRQRGGIHYAQLATSPRLQRLLAVLKRGGWWGTRALVIEADVMAINTAVDELRAQGIRIETRCVGRGRYEYRIARDSGDGVPESDTERVQRTGTPNS